MKKNISTVDESINTTPVSVMMMNMDPFVTYEEGAKYFRLGLNPDAMVRRSTGRM